jgi:hypothetical protein
MRWRVLERLASPDAVQRPVDLPGTATLAAGRDRAALEPVRSECRAHFVDPD